MLVKGTPAGYNFESIFLNKNIGIWKEFLLNGAQYGIIGYISQVWFRFWLDAKYATQHYISMG